MALFIFKKLSKQECINPCTAQQGRAVIPKGHTEGDTTLQRLGHQLSRHVESAAGPSAPRQGAASEIRDQRGAAPPAPEEELHLRDGLCLFSQVEKEGGRWGKLGDPSRTRAALEEILCQRPGLREKFLQRFSDNIRGLC